jgi:hypothetical protein
MNCYFNQLLTENYIKIKGKLFFKIQNMINNIDRLLIRAKLIH